MEINQWTARIRVVLCDHCSFVIEDCGCAEKAVGRETENKKMDSRAQQPKIVAAILGSDLASCLSTLTHSFLASKQKKIYWSLLDKLDEKRMERIREEDDFLLSPEDGEEELEETRYAQETQGPPHHLWRKRDSTRHNARTLPLSGEVVEVWALATHPAYAQHRLASFLSRFFLAYVRAETEYSFVTLQGLHPATERIWKKLGARVMSRIKTRTWEFVDDDGASSFPFAGVTYDICTMDLDIGKSKEKVNSQGVHV